MPVAKCDHGDFTVIYNGKHSCPVCVRDEEIGDLEGKVHALREEIARLKQTKIVAPRPQR